MHTVSTLRRRSIFSNTSLHDPGAARHVDDAGHMNLVGCNFNQRQIIKKGRQVQRLQELRALRFAVHELLRRDHAVRRGRWAGLVRHSGDGHVTDT